MATAIVKLDSLADAIGTPAENNDLLAVGGMRLASPGLAPFSAVLIGRIDVGGGGREFRSAGVDALVDRDERRAFCRAIPMICCRTSDRQVLPSRSSAEAHRLSLARNALRRPGAGSGCGLLLLHVDDVLETARGTKDRSCSKRASSSVKRRRGAGPAPLLECDPVAEMCSAPRAARMTFLSSP